MKVCTDACLFGALIPVVSATKNILDIGTGTGLLSLMLAQRTSEGSQIDALEIEEKAFNQAKENFEQSVFCSKINIFYTDFFQYQTDKKYDVLVCNPPFYKQQLATKNTANNLARHNDNFDFSRFFAHCFNISKPDADLFLLMPFYRKEEIKLLATHNNWNINEIYLIKNKKTQTPIRCIFYLTKKPTATITEKEIIIYTEENQYTVTFKSLLHDFYLDG